MSKVDKPGHDPKDRAEDKGFLERFFKGLEKTITRGKKNGICF